jgi:hypothetical protein
MAALRQLTHRVVTPGTAEEEQVLDSLSIRIGMDIGQVANDALMSPAMVRGVLTRFLQDNVVRVEQDAEGYERFRLASDVQISLERC